MIVSIKDGFKLIGITIVMFCAVFVCTFFLNFYIDAKAINAVISDPEILVLYKAQLATAKFTCAISGGVLGIIALIMLVFYIKLYIDGHANQIGVLKAMGYSELKIAIRFAVFGISVLLGAALGFGGGFILMPTVYRQMTISGLPEIAINFHPVLLLLLVVGPIIVFTCLSCVYAYFALKRPVTELLRGKSDNSKISVKKGREIERSFLKETCFKTITAKKSLAFFVAFACFCFSAMVQMAASMYDLSTETMGAIIFVLGVVLAVTSILMAIMTLVKGNIKNIAIMKAFGYSIKECVLAVLGGYHIFALIGFAVGTVYQYGLLSVMVNLVYKDVGGIPDYSFNVPVFFITFAVFILFYESVMIVYAHRISKISVKEVMTEN